MADIKQAAEWLKEGKSVRRSSWRNVRYEISSGGPNYQDTISGYDTEEAGADESFFRPDDFQGDDWEIAE